MGAAIAFLSSTSDAQYNSSRGYIYTPSNVTEIYDIKEETIKNTTEAHKSTDLFLKHHP